jgi:hypothetical protein
VFLKDAQTNTANFAPAQDLPPAKPTGLSGHRINDGTKAKLYWTANKELDLAGYNIYRSTTKGTGYHKLNNIPIIIPIPYTIYEDTGPLNLDTTYYYVVTAIDKKNKESAYSDEFTLPPDLLPPTILHTPLTQRSLAKKPLFVEVTIKDDMTTVGDSAGRILNITGKVRQLKTLTQKDLNFTPAPNASSTYIGKAEIPPDLITIEGIEYYIEATDGTNTTRWPAPNKWYQVKLNPYIPAQKFITPSNPELVFGKEAKEVTIRTISGAKIWQDVSDGQKIIVWRGNDENGKMVESGAYIYEIKTKDGKRKYGVVIIAK